MKLPQKESHRIALGTSVGIVGIALVFGVTALALGPTDPYTHAQPVATPNTAPYAPMTAQAATQAPQPATDAPTAQSIPGDGAFMVGSEVQPGTYRSSKAREPYCYWSTHQDDTTKVSSVGSSYHGEPTLMTIKPTDVEMESHGCATWTRVR